MLWESLQKPACSPGICDDMQAFFFFLSGGYGSVCVLGGGGEVTRFSFHDNHVSTHRLLDTIHFLCLNF